MSVLTISSGQCGNQLGAKFYEKIYDELGGSEGQPQEMEYFFRSSLRRPNDHIPRAVCIDTEPKVIKKCCIVLNRVIGITTRAVLLIGMGELATIGLLVTKCVPVSFWRKSWIKYKESWSSPTSLLQF